MATSAKIFTMMLTRLQFDEQKKVNTTTYVEQNKVARALVRIKERESSRNLVHVQLCLRAEGTK